MRPAGRSFSATAVSDRFTAGVLWVLVGYVAFIGLNVAMRSRGIVPGYDALSYVDSALRVYLGLTGALDPAGGFAWEARPFTNTLDVLVVGLLWGVMDYHVSIWAIHTAYLALFAFFLRRLLGAATALVIVALTIMSAYFLHQYTNLISEMKVGIFLALFIVYLFHPEARRHRPSLFVITLLLVLLRTIDLLFIVPLALVAIAMRWLDGERRREIVEVIAPVALAIALAAPLLALLLPELLDYLRSTGPSGTLQNWLDMSGVHGKGDLIAAYGRGLLEYNKTVQVAVAIFALASVAVLASGARARLRALRGPALSSLVVFAILMTAATTNIQVVFWLYALEALMLGLWLRALAAPGLVAIAGLALAAAAVPYEFRAFWALNQKAAIRAPITALSRELASSLRELPHPRLYSNFWGEGPLDLLGMEVALERRIPWPKVSQVSYSITVPEYLQALDAANVAFVANRNFGWYTYLNINRHTEEIAREFAARAARHGWLRSARALYDSDPGRYVDVYVRASVEAHLKYAASGDSWMDAQTPLTVRAPAGIALPDGFALDLEFMVPQVDDPGFKAPWHLALRDADGRTVASAEVTQVGDQRVRLPMGGAKAGLYILAFDKSFAPPGDPRRLSALYKAAELRFAPASQP